MLVPIHDFVISCIDHLENIGSLSYADLPNVGIFHYTISKIHSYHHWCSWWWIKVLQNCVCLNFIISNKYCELFFLKLVTGSFSNVVHFRILFHLISNTQIWITTIFQSFFKNTWCFMEKAASLKLTIQSQKCFSWHNHQPSVCHRIASCALPILSPGIFKRDVLNVWDLTLILLPYQRIFFSETNLKPNKTSRECLVVKITLTISTVWCDCFDSCQAAWLWIQ